MIDLTWIDDACIKGAKLSAGACGFPTAICGRYYARIDLPNGSHLFSEEMPDVSSALEDLNTKLKTIAYTGRAT
jgi:hypothetical protein